MSLRRPDSAAELEELSRPLANLVRRLVGGTPLLVSLLGLAYLGSGLTSVAEDEVALVLRFGRLVGETEAEQIHRPGLLLALPPPIDRVLRVPVERVRELELDALDRPDDGSLAGVPRENLPNTIDPTAEGYALTADRNVLQLRARVRYRVDDPVAYALTHRAPEDLLRDVVQAALVRVVAESPVDELLRARREAIGREVVALAQVELERLAVGLELLGVELTKLLPPLALFADFDAVQGAVLGGSRAIQEALAYRELELPRAEADAARRIAEARIEAARRVARARAVSETFGRLAEEHARAPELVRRRLLEETRERVIRAAGRNAWVPPDLENFRVTISGRR